MKDALNPAKVFMQGYRQALLQVETLQAALDELHERAGRTASCLQSERVTGSRKNDPLADAAIGIMDTEKQLVQAAEALNERLKAVLAAIDSVTDERYKTLLLMRYVEGRQWERIAERMSYERTQVFILHGRALAEVQAWMDATPKNPNSAR